MGFSVLNPDYEKIRKAAEPAFALGLLGQAAPLLAPMTKGLPVGASVKSVGKDVDVSLNEASKFLSAKSKFGEVGGTIRQPDKLSDKPYLQINYAEVEQASRGSGKGKELYKALIDEAESMGLRVFSDSTVEKSAVNVYKSLEKGGYKLKDMTKGSLEDGAVYGSGAEKPAFEISNKQKVAPRQEALDTAQRNAALPVEEGGLGLPKDNTPEMRAEAMGYNTPAYHGTTVWEAEDGRKLGDIEAFNRLASTEIVGRKPSIDQMGIWASDRPDELGAGMYSGSQGAIYPLLLRMENPKTTSFEQMARTASNLSTNKALGATEVPRVSDVEPYRQRLKEQGYDSLILRAKEGSPYTEFADQTGYVLLEPSQVRNRFAAFDPMRRNEADILAGVLPLGLLADEEQRKKLYELMPSLLGE